MPSTSLNSRVRRNVPCPIVGFEGMRSRHLAVFFWHRELGLVGNKTSINWRTRPGTKLHKHDYDGNDYDEIVYIIEGRSKWKVGDQEREATAGDVLLVRAGEAHKFVNSGDGPLRQFDIHLNPTFETTWLED